MIIAFIRQVAVSRLGHWLPHWPPPHSNSSLVMSAGLFGLLLSLENPCLLQSSIKCQDIYLLKVRDLIPGMYKGRDVPSSFFSEHFLFFFFWQTCKFLLCIFEMCAHLLKRSCCATDPALGSFTRCSAMSTTDPDCGEGNCCICAGHQAASTGLSCSKDPNSSMAFRKGFLKTEEES